MDQTLTGVESALRDVESSQHVPDDEESNNVDTEVEKIRGGNGSEDREEDLGAAGGTLETTEVKSTAASPGDDCCGDKKASSSKGQDICCICMESEASVLLPCYHNFCETCIDAWVASRRSTCPLCRCKMGTRNDRWQVIEDLPPDFDVKTEIGKTMLHMAQNCGKDFDEEL